MDLEGLERKICFASRGSTWVMLVVTILLGLLALTMPEGVLTEWPQLRPFCEFMVLLFPVIGHYTVTSTFPEVTKLYMSLMLASSPFAFLAPFCSLYPDRRLFLPIQRSDTRSIPIDKHILSATLFSFLAPVLVYFHWFVNPGLDIWFMNFGTSRASLAMFGWFITLAIPFIVGAVLVLGVRLLLGVKLAVARFLGLES